MKLRQGKRHCERSEAIQKPQIQAWIASAYGLAMTGAFFLGRRPQQSRSRAFLPWIASLGSQ
jgi:hypothetical protein